jgi:hypothetical protein
MHDPNQTCASGLHFAAWGYLQHYAPGRKTVLLSISPEDVVSIPTDYNNMKGRACRYKVLREVDQPEELKDLHLYYERNELVDTYEEDLGWIKWSKEDRKSSSFGTYPVDPADYVEVLYKNGEVDESVAAEFNWTQLGNKHYRIVAYRLL